MLETSFPASVKGITFGDPIEGNLQTIPAQFTS